MICSAPHCYMCAASMLAQVLDMLALLDTVRAKHAMLPACANS